MGKTNAVVNNEPTDSLKVGQTNLISRNGDEPEPTVEPGAEAAVDFLAAATALVKRGFSVIPIAPRRKYPPLTPNGAKNRTKNLDVIAAWAARWPNANVALCADDNVVILESDNDAAFRKHVKELTGEELPPTLTSGARSNRPHWIYRCGAVPEGVNFSADGVFELRASNEYVVGPGSIHPEGHRYQIYEDRGAAVFPKWLFDAVKTMHAAKQGQNNAASKFIKPCGAAQIKALVVEAPYFGDYAALIADKSVDISIDPGDRHYSLTSLAGALYSWQIDENGDRVARDVEEIFDLLCGIRDRFCHDSDDKGDEELRRMVSHAMQGEPCTEPEPNVPCWCDGTTVFATKEAFDNRPNPSAKSQCNVDVDLTKHRYTDTGNAERLVARHGENFRYQHDAKKWVHWDGKRWNVDQTAEIHR